jgi:lysophospholipase L1-like esterase
MIETDQILRIPLAPLLVAQGLMVRRKAQMLDEPIGDREGSAGTGRVLRLLIAGDSSAAGVGAGTQVQALSGQLVQRLARRQRVEWRLEATTGHRTQDTIDRLKDLPGQYDIAVTALGVNDATRFMSADAFARRQRELVGILTGQLGVKRVIATAVPPMELFPALPHPLAWVLGRQARRLDQALQSLVAEIPQFEHLSLEIPAEAKYAAPDGYHPSPKAYALWAAQLADRIKVHRV